VGDASSRPARVLIPLLGGWDRDLHPVLDQIELIDLSPRIRILAQTVQPTAVRSLDAIHLGTALHTRSLLTWFVTYDKRLLDAAAAAGLPALAPA
jgi:uncharacterized protein